MGRALAPGIGPYGDKMILFCLESDWRTTRLALPGAVGVHPLLGSATPARPLIQLGTPARPPERIIATPSSRGVEGFRRSAMSLAEPHIFPSLACPACTRVGVPLLVPPDTHGASDSSLEDYWPSREGLVILA